MAVCLPTFASSGLQIVVWKSLFSLGVYRDGVLVEREGGAPCVDVALGGAPAGDKVRQGDERTPEGAFRITHRNPNSSFTLSLGLNYPTRRHAERAFAGGEIDRATRDLVVASDRPGVMPARSTSLGGDIYIHGGGKTPSSWTDGCVGLDDVDIRWLYALAGPGTNVLILP